MLIIGSVAHIESRDGGFIWDPQDIRWLMIMCMRIKFELNKNIFLFQVEILIIISKSMHCWLVSIHAESTYDRRSDRWITVRFHF